MFVNDVFVKRGKQAQVFNFIQIFSNYDRNEVLRHWDMWTFRDGVFLQVVAQYGQETSCPGKWIWMWFFMWSFLAMILLHTAHHHSLPTLDM